LSLLPHPGHPRRPPSPLGAVAPVAPGPTRQPARLGATLAWPAPDAAGPLVHPLALGLPRHQRRDTRLEGAFVSPRPDPIPLALADRDGPRNGAASGA